MVINRINQVSALVAAALTATTALVLLAFIVAPQAAGAQGAAQLCAGQAVTINMNTNGGVGQGTPGPDVILGTSAADTINGAGGDDIICSQGGNDIVNAGSGDDLVYGGGGHDQLNGGSGDDTIFGQPGADRIRGNAGADHLMGGPGYDSLDGGADDDRVNGGGGNDLLHGNGGNDAVYGKAGDDTMFGDIGNDELYGSSGNDIEIGGLGDDLLVGAAGNDIMYAGAGNDLAYGQRGDDYLSGGSGNDQLFAAAGNDRIESGPGADLLLGGSGDDILRGADGIDTLYGQAGDDMMNGGLGPDTCYDGAGTNIEESCGDQTTVPPESDEWYPFGPPTIGDNPTVPVHLTVNGPPGLAVSLFDSVLGPRGFVTGGSNWLTAPAGVYIFEQRVASGWPDPDITCTGAKSVRVDGGVAVLEIANGQDVNCDITVTPDADSLHLDDLTFSCITGVTGFVSGPEGPYEVTLEIAEQVEPGVGFGVFPFGEVIVDASGQFEIPSPFTDEVQITLLNAVPFSDIDILTNGATLVEGFSYGERTNLSTLAGRTLASLGLRNTGSDAVDTVANLELPTSGSHTVVAYVDTGYLNLAMFENNALPVDGPGGRVTVRNLFQAEPIDVYFDGFRVVRQLDPGEVATIQHPAGAVVVDIFAAEIEGIPPELLPQFVGPVDIDVVEGQSLILNATGSDTLLTEVVRPLVSRQADVADGTYDLWAHVRDTTDSKVFTFSSTTVTVSPGC